ncbi:type VII secretion-associated serine protease mycosin [Streptomyces boluensis]|uniref:Type VII secretion-associated serine protease mycosin n=1 Tax=Streptomyces boluensis TaxID=1775135 RepID=A0A964UW65_9ACTN|nr:type VII secretion-associated serine protease mycosin [Streptomyces boluensis]NBE52725.1 type VII secretion-associated serine protease mycosin [Streptomyces boluensis]
MALTGALLLTSAPVASADYVRDQQWMMDVYSMPETWGETKGEGVTVAVIDTGVDGSHPDLAGQVLKGKDFTGGGNPQEDQAGHGTGMASLIAARGHGSGNADGMMGIAPKSKIMPLRVLKSESDRLLDEDWGAAVRYAVDNGAKVINLSVANETGKTISAGREAIAYAQANDVVVVASSGNEAGAVGYPAALPGVIAVSAVDKNGEFWDGSGAGKEVTLAAPGVDVLSANPVNPKGYDISTGTSDSAAVVSGTAALVRAKYPDLTAGQVANRLIKSASFLGQKGLKAPDDKYGYGVVRPNKAVTMDISKGPEAGPLGKVPAEATSKAGGTGAGEDDGTSESGNSSSSSNLPIVIGGAVAVVIVIGVIFAVLRGRRS